MESSPSPSPRNGHLRHRSFKPAPLDIPADFSSSSPRESEKTTQLLKNNEFFRKKFKSPVDLDEFIQLAKSSVNYENHPYGTILLNENDEADKFYIVIEGNVQKFRQKLTPPQPQSATLRNLNLAEFSPSNSECQSARLPEQTIEHDEIILPAQKTRRARGSVMIEAFSEKKFPSIGTPNSRFRMSLMNEKEVQSLFEKRNVRASVFSPSNTVGSPMSSTTRAFENSGFSKMVNEGSNILMTAETEADSNLNEDEKELLNFVCQDNVELQARYFTEEGSLLKAKKVKTFTPGDYFGENFSLVNLQKSTSMLVVSSQQAHFLTLKREDFNNIMATLEQKTQERLQIFLNIFPSVNPKFVKRFASYFKQKCFQTNETIYAQNDTTKDLYLLFNGEVKLLKAFESTSSPRSHQDSAQNLIEVPITTVTKGQTFGEDVILGKETRQETAVANTPNTIIYVLTGTLYEKYKGIFSTFYDLLLPLAQEKFTWRKTKASELFELEKTAPKTLLAYSPKRSSIAINNNGHTLSIRDVPSNLANRKSLCIFPRPSTTRDNSLLSPSVILKEAFNTDSSPLTERKTEKPHRSPSRRQIIVFSKKADKNQSLNKRKPEDLLPGSDLVKFNLKNHFYATMTKKFHKSPAKDSPSSSPRKVDLDNKRPVLTPSRSIQSLFRDLTNPSPNQKRGLRHEEPSPIKYIPTFMPVGNSPNIIDNRVDINTFRFNRCGKLVRNQSARGLEDTALKMSVRRVKV